MKVLVAHNRYRSDAPSGENTMVDAEIELLTAHSVDVVSMIEESDSIPPGTRGVLLAGPGPIYSRRGVRRFKELLRSHWPDVVHLHNVFPLVSPWVIRAASTQGVPVVHTAHNYRHSCINGLHFRDGHPCTDCLPTHTNWPAIAHGCYRGSRAQSVPMVLSQTLHRRTWTDGIARFIALTPFMKEMLERAGVRRDTITVRPTWVADPGAPAAGSRDALYVGRLDENKGVHLLLSAWQGMRGGALDTLHIVGDGTLRPVVEKASGPSARVMFHGSLPGTEVSALMRRSGVVVVPSTGFEGYPLVIAEAFGHGRPVVTVGGGSSATVVNELTGWVAAPSADALARTLESISPDALTTRGQHAREHFESHNSPAAAARSLLAIYDSVSRRR
jgi:glycosyltransferase involved in cell wall biosynthesis